MKARIVRIGNSQGVRFPKLLLQLTRLGDEVEIEAHDGELSIRSARNARRGWEDAFRLMAALGHDRPLEATSQPPDRLG